MFLSWLFQVFVTVMQRWLTLPAAQLPHRVISVMSLQSLQDSAGLRGRGRTARQEPLLLCFSPICPLVLRHWLISFPENQPHSFDFLFLLCPFTLTSQFTDVSAPCWLDTNQITITTINRKPKHVPEQLSATPDHLPLMTLSSTNLPHRGYIFLHRFSHFLSLPSL